MNFAVYGISLFFSIPSLAGSRMGELYIKPYYSCCFYFNGLLTGFLIETRSWQIIKKKFEKELFIFSKSIRMIFFMLTIILLFQNILYAQSPYISAIEASIISTIMSYELCIKVLDDSFSDFIKAVFSNKFWDLIKKIQTVSYIFHVYNFQLLVFLFPIANFNMRSIIIRTIIIFGFHQLICLKLAKIHKKLLKVLTITGKI